MFLLLPGLIKDHAALQKNLQGTSTDESQTERDT